ncbi:inositol 2-dehydrogenase [Lichenicoccus sp.]|uniref:inositol 2-dehydrogenase n=1 Tax=Lichenicoccus sp. TaxID=2781899 RepID=UPI003D0B489E
MIGIAVLGAGRIGKVHARNVANARGCRLLGIADPFGTAAQDLAALHGCRADRDSVALIRHEEVDAVIIGTPTDTHVALMLEAARAGRAVLCEKPIDLDTGRATEAAAELARLGARVMVAFNRRFDPAVIALRQAIDAGEIGDVRQVVITSRDPEPASLDYLRTSGGIFRDMTIHDFDLARFLLGEEPVEVSAIASCLVDQRIEAIGDSDSVMVNLRTASGRQCHINNSRQAVYGYDQRLEISGSKGMLLNDHVRATTVRRFTRERTEAHEPLLNFFIERYEQAYRRELDAFIEAIETQNAMPVTLADGVQALRLADAATESARTGRMVRIATQTVPGGELG